MKKKALRRAEEKNTIDNCVCAAECSFQLNLRFWERVSCTYNAREYKIHYEPAATNKSSHQHMYICIHYIINVCIFAVRLLLFSWFYSQHHRELHSYVRSLSDLIHFVAFFFISISILFFSTFFCFVFHFLS